MFFEMVELRLLQAVTAEEEELLKKPMPMKGMTAVGRRVVEASWLDLSLLCDVFLHHNILC